MAVKVNVENQQVNKITTGIVFNTLTAVGIQEIVRNGGTVIEIYEGGLCEEKLLNPLLWRFVKSSFSEKTIWREGDQNITTFDNSNFELFIWRRY